MQMKQRLLAVGLAVGLGVFGANANAATLHTATHYADGGSFSTKTYHSCQFVNVGFTPITDIQIVLHRSDGSVLATSGVTTVGAGQHRQVHSSGLGYVGFARCRFYSPTAIVGAMRGNISVFHWVAAEGYYETVATEAAR